MFKSVTNILDYIQNYENVFSTLPWTVSIQKYVLAFIEVIGRVNSSLSTAMKHISLQSADSCLFRVITSFVAKWLLCLLFYPLQF